VTGPLQGITVIDLTEGWAGPFCTMELGDLGATVIKVEPSEGDYSRRLGPPFLSGESLPFLALNRSKLSIAVNTTTAPGARIVRLLAGTADVVVESFSPGEADRFGIGYEELRAENPRLIYGTVTPYGQYGPYADRAASELVLQAMTGVFAFQPDPARYVAFGGDPVNLFAGKYLLHGILAALIDQRRTGEGQRVDVAMLHAGLARTMSEWPAADDAPPGVGGEPPAQRPPIWAGRDRSMTAADGRIEFNFRVNGYTPNDDAWMSFFAEVGADELVRDSRFGTESDRALNFETLRSGLEPHLSSLNVDELLTLVTQYGGMAAPWYDLAAAHEHPQARALDMVVTTEHPIIGSLRSTAPPYEFYGTPLSVNLPPPSLGQHTIEVLRQLHFGDTEIEELIKTGVV
jgi:crotonobetainyl-CoA:carnitine CoA-transferase CaiB-like acyl-CoA transferase